MTGNPLTDLIPAKARKYVYAAATLAALILGAWQVSNGNVETFVGLLVSALVTALAASNTSTPAGPPASEGGIAPTEDGSVDIGLAVLICILVGVVLLLFGIRF